MSEAAARVVGIKASLHQHARRYHDLLDILALTATSIDIAAEVPTSPAAL